MESAEHEHENRMARYPEIAASFRRHGVRRNNQKGKGLIVIYRIEKFRVVGFLLTLFFAAACFAADNSGKIKYMIFEGGGPDQGPGPDMELNMGSLAEKFGPVDPSSSHMYGYGIQQIRILSRSSAFIAAEINRALDAAERTAIPVWLHIDPLYAWGADAESCPEDAPPVKFWNEPDMREWGQFPVDGELPSYIPRMWFNWGPWCSPASAVPAIGSPRFVEFARAQLRAGVLAPLTERIVKWKAEGREHLFAGINVGWEIYLPYYHKGWRLFSNGGKQGPILAEFPKNVQGLELDDALIDMQLGFASLYWRGWNEPRLRDAAAKEGISRDQIFLRLCYECIHDYMQSLAEECHDHGIGREKVYTHIVAAATVYKPDSNMPPIWTAVNPYSTPGFTLDNKGAAKFDMEKLKQQLAEAPGSRGTGFGAVETYFGLGGRNYVSDEVSYKKELDEMFGNGAQVQVVFAAFPFGAKSPVDAFPAIRSWLKEGMPQADSL